MGIKYWAEPIGTMRDWKLAIMEEKFVCGEMRMVDPPKEMRMDDGSIRRRKMIGRLVIKLHLLIANSRLRVAKLNVMLVSIAAIKKAVSVPLSTRKRGICVLKGLNQVRSCEELYFYFFVFCM